MRIQMTVWGTVVRCTVYSKVRKPTSWQFGNLTSLFVTPGVTTYGQNASASAPAPASASVRLLICSSAHHFLFLAEKDPGSWILRSHFFWLWLQDFVWFMQNWNWPPLGITSTIGLISIIIIVIGMPFVFTGRSWTGVLALWGRIPRSIEGD